MLKALVLCLDVSESMGCGEPEKLNLAIDTIEKAVRGISRGVRVGLVTFDVTAEVLLGLQPLDEGRIRGELGKVTPRGVSCAAAGLSEAVRLVGKSGDGGEVLLLTDGRANLSADRTGGFEGSLELERELLQIAEEAGKKNVVVHAVAVGEDAFTYSLRRTAENTKGRYWVAEDFRELTAEAISAPKPLKASGLRVHVAPAELPSAQPTWTKESQSTHVAVASQDLYQAYRAHRRAFLVNQSEGREARTALISIESGILTAYRERRPKTAQKVRTGEAILLDKSYRDYLALGEGAIVKLVIY